MSKSDTAPPKKTAKKKPRKINTSQVFFTGMVPVGDVSDWPELAAVPTLQQAAGMDSDGDGPAAQWQDLLGSIAEHGIIEKLKCLPAPGGKWWVADGRSRRAGGAESGLRELPIEEITAAQAEVIARESMKRRMLDRQVLAYMRCLEHAEELLTRGRGRPRKSELDQSAPNQHKLAAECRVGVDTIGQCLKVIEYFRAHPAAREKYEPQVLGGVLSVSHVIPADKGGDSPNNQPGEKTKSTYATWHRSIVSVSFQFKQIESWTDEELANAGAALDIEMMKCPVAARHLLLASLQKAGDKPAPKDDEVTRRKNKAAEKEAQKAARKAEQEKRRADKQKEKENRRVEAKALKLLEKQQAATAGRKKKGGPRS